MRSRRVAFRWVIVQLGRAGKKGEFGWDERLG